MSLQDIASELDGFMVGASFFAVEQYRDKSGYRDHIRKLEREGKPFHEFAVGNDRHTRSPASLMLVVEGDKSYFDRVLAAYSERAEEMVDEGYPQSCDVWLDIFEYERS